MRRILFIRLVVFSLYIIATSRKISHNQKNSIDNRTKSYYTLLYDFVLNMEGYYGRIYNRRIKTF